MRPLFHLFTLVAISAALVAGLLAYFDVLTK